MNVVTHDSDSRNDVLFVSSCHRKHALLADTNGDMHTWILDSGASFHVMPHREWFSDYIGGRHGVVHLGDNYACEIAAIGTVQLQFQHGSALTLQHVRHVPQLKKSLISTGQLDDDGFHTTFANGKWKICKGSRVIAKVVKVILCILSIYLV